MHDIADKLLDHAVPQSKLESALNYTDVIYGALRYLFENIRNCKTPDDYIRLLPFNINSTNS